MLFAGGGDQMPQAQFHQACFEGIVKWWAQPSQITLPRGLTVPVRGGFGLKC